ncbi:hypothetical protein AHAS_Ahas14G0102700 [Arachis hypogaea]
MDYIKGINVVVSHCHSLEELSVKRLHGAHDGEEMVSSKTTSLTSVCLKEIVNGDWDDTMRRLGTSMLDAALIDVHLEKIQVSDMGLVSLSKCLS